jgi:hypothetical protein
MGLARSGGRAAGEPDVLALYYPWYGMDTWSEPALSDHPLIPYNSFEQATVARHVGWAKEAGIDVLVSAWFGTTLPNPTETTFQTLLDTAASSGIHAAILLETDSPDFFPSFDSQAAGLRHVIEVHAQHPGYFRSEGKPVLFVWHPQSLWIGDQRPNRDSAEVVQAWRALRSEVDPDHTTLWIAETSYSPYLDVFDGLFAYNIAAAADPAAALGPYARAVRDARARTGLPKLWVATAMAGYDDTGIDGRPGRFARDRENGAYYRRSFAAAIASDPDWISITSFNEWIEGHQIEPSVTYGDLYLRLTSELTARWKGSSP